MKSLAVVDVEVIPDVVSAVVDQWRLADTWEKQEHILDRISNLSVFVHPLVAQVQTARYYTPEVIPIMKMNTIQRNVINRIYARALLTERCNWRLLFQLRNSDEPTILFMNSWIRAWLFRLQTDDQVSLYVKMPTEQNGDKKENVGTNQTQHTSPMAHGARAWLTFFPHKWQRTIPLDLRRRSVLGTYQPWWAFFDCRAYWERDLGFETVTFVADDIRRLQPPTPSPRPIRTNNDTVNVDMTRLEQFITFELKSK